MMVVSELCPQCSAEKLFECFECLKIVERFIYCAKLADFSD